MKQSQKTNDILEKIFAIIWTYRTNFHSLKELFKKIEKWGKAWTKSL